MTGPGSVWSHPISIDDVSERGIHVDLVADEATRAEMARVAGLRDLPRLSASFDVTREGDAAVRIVGEVSAAVGQNCVVTLEPLESDVREAIDLLFTSRAERSIADSEGKITLDFSDPDPVEPVREGAVDLAAIATEFFLLGIDPYPRKEGAVFEAPKVPEDPTKHPFAALEALKKAGDRDKT
jgi:uncharacterized metal-binding protein YceD (DUF177 family)